MSILKRYKIKEEEGFKKLVLSLEQSKDAKQRQILQAIFLEDPLYAQYLPMNVITFDYIKELEPVEIRELWDACPNAAKIFVFAFFGSADEEHFLTEQLPPDMHYQYNDEKEMNRSVATYQRRTARLKMIEITRNLQDQFRIRHYPWNLPPRRVLKGEHYVIPKAGPFELRYDNDQLALEGEYKDKLRSGMWNHYFSNGSLMACGIYNMDEKEDEWEFYYSNGKLKSKGRYFQNLKEGNWVEFDKDGIENTIQYKKGNPVKP